MMMMMISCLTALWCTYINMENKQNRTANTQQRRPPHVKSSLLC